MSGNNKDVTAQSQAEKDLLESQARLHLALEASGVAMWEVDFPAGNVLLDSHWREIVGEEPREARVPFSHLLRLVTPEERMVALDQIRAVIRGERDDYQVEQRLQHRAGHWVWIESRGRVIARDAAGQALRMIGTSIDISTRKATEAALRQQKQFLEALHQTSLDLLSRHEMDDLLQTIVDRSAALLAAPFGELALVEGNEFVVQAFTRNQPFLFGDRVGRNDALLSWQVHDTRKPLVIDDYSKHESRRRLYDRYPVRAVVIFPILHGDQCLGVLGLSRTKQGHTFSVAEIQRGAMLAQQAAIVVHNAGVYDKALRDAESRTLALRESEERFRSVFDESPIIITLISLPEGRIAEVNAAGIVAFGFRREEIIGSTSLDLNIWADPDDRIRYRNMLHTMGSFSGRETQMRRKNGEIFTVLYSGSLVKIGGKTYSLNTLQDITLQKQALDRLRHSHKIELLGNLASGIAHDFNNILSGMMSNIELARLDLADDHAARRWVERIGAAAGHAKNLVRQILTFSRMEEGKLEPTRLQPVVAVATELMRTTMPSMMDIVVDISDECPPVMADETQIHQVVMNLCTNAWHALPEHGGRIDVSLMPVADRVVLRVRDNGCGMDSATLQRIFEPFFTTKETGKGTGLGLAVTQGIVKSHSGMIMAESTPGKGTTIEISFPAISSQPAAIAPAASPAKGQNERILFVDDEAMVGEPLSELLRRIGYRVTYEADPKTALSTFRAHPDNFDLVVTDLAMPSLTGRELATELLQIRPTMPVILLSGLIEPKKREQLLHAGVRAVITKPASTAELAAAISQALNTDDL